MQYKAGDIVVLNNGKSVYIFAVDEKAKEYQVVDTDNQDKLFFVRENEIYMPLLS